MASIADYVAYCQIKFEFVFSYGDGGGSGVYKASIGIEPSQNVIWAMYPSTGTNGVSGDGLCITTSPNPLIAPNASIPVSALTFGGPSAGSPGIVTFSYSPSQDSQKAGGSLYFNAYLWGDETASSAPGVTFNTVTNSNVKIMHGTNPVKDGDTLPVTWKTT